MSSVYCRDKDLVCEIPGLEARECHVSLQFPSDNNLVLCGNIPTNLRRSCTFRQTLDIFVTNLRHICALRQILDISLQSDKPLIYLHIQTNFRYICTFRQSFRQI